MNKSHLRRLLYAALFLIFVLRLDLWQWNDPRRLFGLPVGLTYHIGICAAVSLTAALLVRFAWPQNLDAGESEIDP